RLERAGNLTPQNVRDLAAYGRLLARTADELNGYGRVLESSLARISDGSIQLGTEAAWNLSAEMAGRLGDVVRTAYRQPDTDVIRQLVRYVDSDAMRANLAKFGQAGADNLADVLLAGLGSGQGASAVARLLTNWYAVPLAWSENMTRTLGNWSYRMASHASYRLNSDIVEGWYWSSSLDRRTCFPAGTVVRTQAGNKPIEAVSVGDRVLTNSGRYRAVYDTMRRTYSGKAITIKAGGSTVTMTADHPVLVDRLGKRYWVTADHCKVGDVVFVSPDDTPNGDNHFGCEVSIERRVGDADYSVAGGNQFGNLPGVRLRASVPIFERLSTSLATALDPLIRSRVIAAGATVHTAAASSPSVGGSELFPTVVADSFFHAPIISIDAHHIQCEVYDLSVETDHTFVANGVLVHNCLSCVSMHGTRHTHDEVLNDHHRGRCLVPGELVTTRRGDVPVEDVRIGDEVYTHKGNWRRVVRLYQRDYSGDVITVRSSDHEVTVTPEHPVLTQRGWVDASDLSASDTFLIHHSRYTGKVYDLEVETDHSFFAGGIAVHNCAAIPIVRGGLVADSIGTGEAWFDGLSDAQKREIMGPGRYDLYTSGRWDWRAVSKPYNDP
ncbi:MAG: Hint domain-containing protein, partial [Anaerolineae bacterium]|nr:Hint domain-containing protein [Anaerolineae bacterium]